MNTVYKASVTVAGMKFNLDDICQNPVVPAAVALASETTTMSLPFNVHAHAPNRVTGQSHAKT